MERPILFSTPMVRAILDGRKTQTRRIVKIPDIIKTPDLFYYVGSSKELDIPRKAIPYDDRLYHAWRLKNNNMPMWVIHSHKLGDILWVRETFLIVPPNIIFYKADPDNKATGCWKPSIFMPKQASRIKLQITDIRVQRLQDITDKDAIAEGVDHVIDKITGYCGYDYLSGGYNLMTTPYHGYSSLWRKINGQDSWSKNPWVWVIEFKKL